MKLKESKEKVPATFVTSYISEAWEKAGYIKTDIDAIKSEYSGANVVVECLQDIMDAYLVAAGRLQNYLDSKGDISLPEEQAQESIKESIDLPVDEDVNIDTVNIEFDDVKLKKGEHHEHNHDEYDHNDHEFHDGAVFKKAAMMPITKEMENEFTKPSGNEFEFSCDFDDPDLTQEDAENVAKVMQIYR